MASPEQSDEKLEFSVVLGCTHTRPSGRGRGRFHTVLKSASVSVASLARPGQFRHLGEVCCYGPGCYGTDANEPTRAHARLRNLSWMTYSPCDDHGHNNGDEASFPLNGKHISK